MEGILDGSGAWSVMDAVVQKSFSRRQLFAARYIFLCTNHMTLISDLDLDFDGAVHGDFVEHLINAIFWFRWLACNLHLVCFVMKWIGVQGGAFLSVQKAESMETVSEPHRWRVSEPVPVCIFEKNFWSDASIRCPHRSAVRIQLIFRVSRCRAGKLGACRRRRAVKRRQTGPAGFVVATTHRRPYRRASTRAALASGLERVGSRVFRSVFKWNRVCCVECVRSTDRRCCRRRCTPGPIRLATQMRCTTMSTMCTRKTSFSGKLPAENIVRVQQHHQLQHNVRLRISRALVSDCWVRIS